MYQFQCAGSAISICVISISIVSSSENTFSYSILSSHIQAPLRNRFSSVIAALRIHGKKNFFPVNILALYGNLRFIIVFKRILGKICQFLYCGH
jgi:hypothetical protein